MVPIEALSEVVVIGLADDDTTGAHAEAYDRAYGDATTGVDAYADTTNDLVIVRSSTPPLVTP